MKKLIEIKNDVIIYDCNVRDIFVIDIRKVTYRQIETFFSDANLPCKELLNLYD